MVVGRNASDAANSAGVTGLSSSACSTDMAQYGGASRNARRTRKLSGRSGRGRASTATHAMMKPLMTKNTSTPTWPRLITLAVSQPSTGASGPPSARPEW
ncbi:hypothetical protein D3C81_1140960 [compost metagenome]